jgi:predicted restriction endonuclease
MDKSKLNDFSVWMRNNSKLSDTSIYKYVHGLNTVSNDMIKAGAIHTSLLEMNPTELEIATKVILQNQDFTAKNNKGKRMYSNALKQFRSFVFESRVAEIDTTEQSIIDTLSSDTSIPVTTRQQIIQARVGQGDFRKELFDRYDGKCVVTGIDLSQMLIASHIKPWAVSDNQERLSADNGLLLSANFDKLFDLGLITFKNTGEMLVSRNVNEYNRKRIGIENGMKVELKATVNTLINLEYHRDMLFVK